MKICRKQRPTRSNCGRYFESPLNAAEEMTEGGTLKLETSYDAPSDKIQIRISDTGKGIPENFMDKIFQPFFTTKTKGTGLGLAIIRRLIEQHEGR
jgi:signal transduction histidine kinase